MVVMTWFLGAWVLIDPRRYNGLIIDSSALPNAPDPAAARLLSPREHTWLKLPTVFLWSWSRSPIRWISRSAARERDRFVLSGLTVSAVVNGSQYQISSVHSSWTVTQVLKRDQDGRPPDVAALPQSRFFDPSESEVKEAHVDLPKGLVEDVKAGRVILFLGAGATMGSIDPDGNRPPLGDGLRDLLVSEYLPLLVR